MSLPRPSSCPIRIWPPFRALRPCSAVEGGTIPYSYLWSTNEYTAIISDLTSGNYIITITDNNGCIGIESIFINQPTAPLTSIDSTIMVNCYGAKTGEIFLSVSGGTPNYKYLWNYGQTTDSIIGVQDGTYIVSITDANKCILIDTIELAQPEPIDISWTSVESHCGFEDGSATLDTIYGGTAPYNWAWSNGESGLTSGSWPSGVIGQTTDSLAFGSHSITVTDNNGCIRTFDFNINFIGFIPVTAGATQIQCFGGTGDLATNVGSGYAPFIYTYYDSDSSIIGVHTSYAKNDSLFGLLEGNYFVIVQDSVGCKGNGSDSIGTQPTQVVANIQYSDVTCKGLNDGFATVHADGGNPFVNPPYQYLWNDSLTSTDSTVFNLKPNITYSVIITDANGCTISKNVLVTEPNKSIAIGIDTIIPVSCYKGKDGQIKVFGIGGNGNFTYSWSNSQGTSTAFNLAAGNYIVTLSDVKGCTTDTILTVSQPTEIVITNVSTKTSCRDSHDGKIELEVTGGVGNYTYLWNTKDFSTIDMIENQYAGDYIVTVTDENSCPKTDTIAIASNDVECLEVPSAFTPNGDGVNDKWIIKNIDLYPDVKVEIYNRWGNIIFRRDKFYFDFEWDGTFNGQLLAATSYVYILTFPDGKVEPKTGVVTIIR